MTTIEDIQNNILISAKVIALRSETIRKRLTASSFLFLWSSSCLEREVISSFNSRICRSNLEMREKYNVNFQEYRCFRRLHVY